MSSSIPVRRSVRRRKSPSTFVAGQETGDFHGGVPKGLLTSPAKSTESSASATAVHHKAAILDSASSTGSGPWIGGRQDPLNDAKPPPLKHLGNLLSLAPFDIEGWKAGTFKDKCRIAALSWSEYGFGAPLWIYSFYVLKHVLWFVGWRFFCAYASDSASSDAALGGSGGSGGAGQWDAWDGDAWVGWVRQALTADAMQRLVLWNLLFEVCGLGCASGPLTGRFTIPSPAIFHWLWPGTIKMPYDRERQREKKTETERQKEEDRHRDTERQCDRQTDRDR